MKINFYGATREVTGSCHCVEFGDKRVLLDCGMQQGSGGRSDQSFPFHPGQIDHIIISHAHIDHSGRLPLLVKRGFKGSIYATEPTCKLLDIMLRDSAHIQELEAQWASRKKRRAGDPAPEPLYTVEDACRVLPLLVPCRYNTIIELSEDEKLRFSDAGHLLGSAYVEMWIREENVSKKLVYSGDIGVSGHPMICDPTYLDEADIVIMESTYGNKNHGVAFDTVTELAKVIETTLGGGGNVVCPSFAVGRTQDLLYHLREIKQRGLVRSNPNFPVYLDSPLAQAATKIYSGDLCGYLDEEAKALIASGVNPLSFEGLRFTETSNESKRLNDDYTPKVIISSSGMCDAGRIRHHLKHNLWRSECSVVFTGFQALGTLGRTIIDGIISSVSLFGEEIAIRCQIHNFKAMSSHADKAGLHRFVDSFKKKPQCIFVVHGEANTCKDFAQQLIEKGYTAVAPKYTSVYDLETYEPLFEGRDTSRRVDLERHERRSSPVFDRLQLAGARLMEVIGRHKGGSNKELSKFADQIDALSSKWDM